MANKYDNIELLINWDDNPATNPKAKQIIHSTVSKDMPVGDYNVYVGKVIDGIYINDRNNLVFKLRLPASGDLSNENLNRKPLSTTAVQELPETPETIMQKPNYNELMQMKQNMLQADKEYRSKQ